MKIKGSLNMRVSKRSTIEDLPTPEPLISGDNSGSSNNILADYYEYKRPIDGTGMAGYTSGIYTSGNGVNSRAGNGGYGHGGGCCCCDDFGGKKVSNFSNRSYYFFKLVNFF